MQKSEAKEKLDRDRQKREMNRGMNGLIHKHSEPEAHAYRVHSTEATVSAHGALSLLTTAALFMNLLWLCYLVNYVLVERT